MIFDNIEYAYHYSGINGKLTDVLKFLISVNVNIEKIDMDRMELGNGVYASYQEEKTTSADKKLYEAHKKYIDIHYILDGDEFILTRLKDTLLNESLYDTDKDIIFFNDNTDGCPLPMTPGHFAVLFPHDGHKPLIKYKQPFVKKIIVKVPYKGDYLDFRDH